ncbi:MAG TPA: NAD(+) diphosphatase [Gammaproteobacteria bacterium]|nr:NAD(+) diphosphatase [Gammaproteobacteria bacterium]
MSEARNNFLAAAPLDRIGHRRGDAKWLAAARARGVYLPVWRRKALVSAAETPEPLFLGHAALAGEDPGAPRGECVLLGERQGQPCFALGLAGDTAPLGGGRFEDIRALGEWLAPGDAALLAYARAMIVWHERHRHCGLCGSPTRSMEAGHTRICDDCQARHFPRVDPAIIVLVADEDRCLLGRQPAWPPGRYSAIAGFVEPGESLEDAVRREVLEETGVEVRGVAYDSSQPWPFPSSLMLGFSARPASETIARRDGELEDARWVTREEIVAGRFMLPPAVSIAYRLVEQWFDAAPGRRLAAEAKAGPWFSRPDS